MSGTVYLVGAGPGDRGLISAKGLKLLREADVVLYDRLVNPLLLEDTKQSAELQYVGKLPDRHVLRQEAIHDELVRYAVQGKNVVRLKGGDPSVFGRVGEEASFLEEYGIAYEIVPGITAGIAAPAYAGVPVTHRMLGTSFAVATGHSQGPNGLKLDWQALAQIDTVAFYMGVKNLPTIAENLITHGRSKSEPVLLIQWGATNKQRTLRAELGTIASKATEAGFTNPAITLVGQVALLYKGKSWFEKRPLFGRSPIVLNDGHSNSLIDALQEDGAEPFLYPRFVNEETGVPEINLLEVDEFAFYESADVDVFFRWLQKETVDIRNIEAALCAKTDSAENALRKRGIRSDEKALTGQRIWLGPEGKPMELDYQFVPTRILKRKQSSEVVFDRVKEEESITEMILPTAEAVAFLVEASQKDKRLQQLPVLCLDEEAFSLAKNLGYDTRMAKDVSEDRIEIWMKDWLNRWVETSESNFVRGTWQPN